MTLLDFFAFLFKTFFPNHFCSNISVSVQKKKCACPNAVDYVFSYKTRSCDVGKMENPCRYYKLADHACLEFHTNTRPVRLQIKVAKCAGDVDAWLSAVQPSVLGLDIEWKPVFNKNGKRNRASLLQLSYKDSAILIQLFYVPVSPMLREILADERVKKVGVGISGDTAMMELDWGVTINGSVELGHGKSLAKVAFAATEIKLSKQKKICLSNWENRTLSTAQVIYAALDAWVASESFAVMSRTHAVESESAVIM